MKRLLLAVLSIGLMLSLGACASGLKAVEAQPEFKAPAPVVVAAKPEPVKVVEPTTISISEVVMFDWDKSNIRDNQTSIIDKVAGLLAKYFETKITLFGYASIEGTEKHNQELSQARADSIQDALIKSGVSADSITVSEGKGETDTFAADLPSNRRVTISAE